MQDKLGLFGRLLHRMRGRRHTPAPDAGDAGTEFGMELALAAEQEQSAIAAQRRLPARDGAEMPGRKKR